MLLPLRQGKNTPHFRLMIKKNTFFSVQGRVKRYIWIIRIMDKHQ